MSFSFFPRTAYKTKSKFSGEIEVKEQLGRYTLHVNNLIQSGGMIEGIWKKPLRFAQGKLSVSNCLILGLGGGTVVQLIAGHSARPHFCLCKKVKALYPGAKIIGIEIDSEIIKIGKKFFGLNKIENLEIINIDAFDWIKTCSDDSNHLNKKFDLIIVDLYIGDEFPKKAMNNEFLKKLKKLLSKKGMVIVNWLKNKDVGHLRNKLTTNFSQVESLDSRTNLFLICHP